MARLILYVIAVAALVTAAVWLANDPGSVSLTWHGWRADTSVSVLLVAIIVIVAIILLIARLIGVLAGTVQAFTARRRERRFARGLTSLGDGFAAAHAGQEKAARKFAKEAATLLRDNAAVLMLRKDNAVLANDADELRKVAEELMARPETELAGLRALANNALKNGDTAGARGHARRALQHKEAPAWALEIALDTEIATENWDGALGILETKPARDAFSPFELRRLRARLMALQSQALLNQGDAVNAAATAKRAIDADETNTDAVVAFAKAMAAQGKGRKAVSAVERAWAATPNAALLHAYRVLVPNEPALEWALRVDGLAKAAPDHIESRLAVAQASLDAELWGQVRSKLVGLTDADVDRDVRMRAARMLAEVERRERGDSTKAAQWLQLALDSGRMPAQRAGKPKSAAEILA